MKTLIVTAIGSFSASAVIRSCREAGYRVVGTDIHPQKLLAEGREADHFVRVPRFDAGERYIKALRELAAEEHAEGILPLTDAELDILNRERERFFPTQLWVSPEEAVLRARDKRRSREAAEKVFADAVLKEKFFCIPTILLSGAPEEMRRLSAQLPLILKPFDGRSSEGLYRVRTEVELRRALAEIWIAGAEERYLAQPMIPGRVVCVDTVRFSDGHCVAAPREEFRRTANGAGLAVHVFRDALLESACAALSAALDIRGCVNYEFIHEPSGCYYFLECNPRFSGGTGFSVAAGCDVVKLHLSVFSGRAAGEAQEAKDCWIAKKYIEVLTK